MPTSTPTQESLGVVAFKVKVNGAEVATITNQIQSVEFESTFTRPDLCVITVHAPEVSTANPLPTVNPGDLLDLAVERPGTQATALFTGDVNSVELVGRTGASSFVIRAYDKRQRLYRGVNSRVFLDMTHSDVMSQLFRSSGLSTSLTATRGAAKYLAQNAVSDGDYLEQLLREVGHVSVRDGTTVSCKPLHALNTDVGELEFGNNLESYSFRITAESWLSKVEYTDWDPVKKKEIIGTGAATRVIVGDQKTDNGNRILGQAKTSVPRLAMDQATAEAGAQAAFDRTLTGSRQLEGSCDGNENLVPGGIVTIKGINPTFNGPYRLSMVRHRWDQQTAFVTEFACNTAGDTSITSLLADASDAGPASGLGGRMGGVAPAIVTDTDDPEDLGRVKVEFPWMPKAGGSRFGSDWLRVVMAGGGASGKGLYVIPEVDDEVLVAFEHGDVRRGYVLGGVYNSIDKPPIPKAQAVKSGRTPQKVFRSSTGHILTFDDSSDKPGVELVTASKDIVLKLDDKSGALSMEAKKSSAVITVTADGDITIKSKSGGVTIEAMKDITLKATGNIKLDATQNVDVKGINVNVKASAKASVEGTASAEIKGATVDVKGQAMTNITGGLVKIN